MVKLFVVPFSKAQELSKPNDGSWLAGIDMLRELAVGEPTPAIDDVVGVPLAGSFVFSKVRSRFVVYLADGGIAIVVGVEAL